MQAEEEFRSRLRDDLGRRSAPPVGALVPDALSAGRRMRRRRQTLRAVSGTAALAVVAIGSVTLSGAFGADAPSSTVAGPGDTSKPAASSPPAAGGWAVAGPAHSAPSSPPSSSPTPGGTRASIDPTWTVPPAATVGDPAWVTPQAIVAEIKKLLPAQASTSQYSGSYAYSGGDPREMWAVDGKLSVATSTGPKEVDVTLHKISGFPPDPCRGESSCVSEVLPDGSQVVLDTNWNPLGGATSGAYVMVTRKGGMSVQVSTQDWPLWSENSLFTLASAPAFGTLKMDKSFVTQADATIRGTFMNPPAGG